MIYHHRDSIRPEDNITMLPLSRFYSFWDYGLVVIGWRYMQSWQSPTQQLITILYIRTFELSKNKEGLTERKPFFYKTRHPNNTLQEVCEEALCFRLISGKRPDPFPCCKGRDRYTFSKPGCQCRDQYQRFRPANKWRYAFAAFRLHRLFCR